MKSKRGANIIYPTRRLVNGMYPIGSHVISVDQEGRINCLIKCDDGALEGYSLHRQEARLLAKRILQALEETK